MQLHNYYYISAYIDRLYKNKVQEAKGWDNKMIQWCLKEATEKGLRESDFWGGFALDEMKIQVDLVCTQLLSLYTRYNIKPKKVKPIFH
jgi:hypothetical protein